MRARVYVFTPDQAIFYMYIYNNYMLCHVDVLKDFSANLIHFLVLMSDLSISQWLYSYKLISSILLLFLKEAGHVIYILLLRT